MSLNVLSDQQSKTKVLQYDKSKFSHQRMFGTFALKCLKLLISQNSFQSIFCRLLFQLYLLCDGEKLHQNHNEQGALVELGLTVPTMK